MEKGKKEQELTPEQIKALKKKKEQQKNINEIVKK